MTLEDCYKRLEALRDDIHLNIEYATKGQKDITMWRLELRIKTITQRLCIETEHTSKNS